MKATYLHLFTKRLLFHSAFSIGPVDQQTQDDPSNTKVMGLNRMGHT